MSNNDFCWLVCYIDTTYLDRVYRDLGKSPEYKDVEVYIPTVKILKKTFKGQNHFEEVPLLFNYGFFKVPRRFAIFKNYLDNMKANIGCIFAWVNDPTKVYSTKPRIREDGKSIYTDSNVPIATATSEEIAELVKSAYYSNLHSAEDIDKLKPGQVITLRGYPFDDMQAEVIEVYPKKQKVKVKIEMMDAVRPVMVSFDNVFFTVYHNRAYDDSISIKDSLDAMAEAKTLDKKLYKNKKHEND